MVIPTNPPGHWQHFILRNDNRGLTTEQIRQKYLKEQLLFENYINFIQQQQPNIKFNILYFCENEDLDDVEKIINQYK